MSIDTPLQLRLAAVRDVERIVGAAATTHAEHDQREVTIGRLDTTVVIPVGDHRNDIAIDAVVLERRVRIRIQTGEFRQKFLGNECPEFPAGSGVDSVQVAIIGCGEDDHLRIGGIATVHDCRRLRVQCVAHVLAGGSSRIHVFVQYILAARPANQ